jgi:hypothetical protein
MIEDVVDLREFTAPPKFPDNLLIRIYRTGKRKKSNIEMRPYRGRKSRSKREYFSGRIHDDISDPRHCYSRNFNSDPDGAHVTDKLRRAARPWIIT